VAAGLSDWVKLPTVSVVFETAIARSGISPEYRQKAEKMVHRALTMPIPLGQERSIPALCRCPNIIREMEFLFPLPEPLHPGLSETRPGRLLIERGFIKGFVDLVVEHDGKVYFADWKSDVLGSYESEIISGHVRDHYESQVQLYSLALVKALGIGSEAVYESRFGGLFYVFLRALDPDDEGSPGIYFTRPSWSEILRLEADLKRFDMGSERGRA
jgi:exodeoxyribonuclease V beta subunit